MGAVLPNVFIKHLTFDVRSSSAANVLWVQAGGMLGRHRHRHRHRHRGPVSGYVLEGSWRYQEYDWVAHPGDLIRESPGRTHTLYSEHGMKTFFWLNGPLEFLDDEDRVMEVLDVSLRTPPAVVHGIGRSPPHAPFRAAMWPLR